MSLYISIPLIAIGLIIQFLNLFSENYKEAFEKVPYWKTILFYLSIGIIIFGSYQAIYQSIQKKKYERQVYMDFSLACHQWKNTYMSLFPGHFDNIEGEYEDVWELLHEKGVREYSPELWSHYRPLFRVGINSLYAELDRLLRANSDVISYDFRALVLETQRSLKVEQFTYEYLPLILHLVEDKNHFFSYRFQAVIELLAKLDREAEKG